jgi:hypothetical protein
LHNLISKILTQAHRNSSNTLGSSPPHNVVFVFEAIQKILNDELELIVLTVIQTIIIIFFHVDILIFRWLSGIRGANYVAAQIVS